MINSKAMAAILAAMLLMLGCGRQTAEDLFAEGEAAAAASDGREQAMERFAAVVERFPADPLAPRALKQLAILEQQKGDMPAAIARYERLLEEYPSSDEADEAQFMIAFIYEEYLQELDKARAAYKRVIDNFPDSELAASARRLLPNVGRDPEEWVEFEDAPAAP